MVGETFKVDSEEREIKAADFFKNEPVRNEGDGITGVKFENTDARVLFDNSVVMYLENISLGFESSLRDEFMGAVWGELSIF